MLMLGVLGHDIRNPVGTIKMAATLIPHSGPVTERQLQLVNNIQLSIDRINHIVNDLLDLAKSTAGQTLPLKKNPCSLSRLCHEIVEEMRLRHLDRQFNVMTPEQVDGCWDEIRLGQLLGNLLANAVQYGAADRSIGVRLTDDGDDVELAVTNDGEPIPATHLESIFKSFARLPSEGQERQVASSNLGLGLFISREIATAHGGTISVASNRAQGTTFSVHLPKFDTP